jgi:two-component system KDP operon response regulator KdpE
MDGSEVIAGLRGWTTAPIIVLTGRTDQPQKIAALDAGADDYVTKPFDIEELFARMRAVARRAAPDGAESAAQIGSWVVDLATHRVRPRDDAGPDQRLTPTEWRLLERLVRHPGRLVTQHQLLTEVWGPAYQKETNYLRLYMAQLRRKLEPDPGHPRYLLTDPGMGYRYVPCQPV